MSDATGYAMGYATGSKNDAMGYAVLVLVLDLDVALPDVALFLTAKALPFFAPFTRCAAAADCRCGQRFQPAPAGRWQSPERIFSMEQYNVALQVVNALYKRNGEGTAVICASLLAEDVAPKFPDVPVALIHMLAARVLAIFYEPLTLDDVEASNLKAVEKSDVCDYLARAYRAEADTLRSMPMPPH